MASEMHGGRGYVYCLRYQVVWCVKNRHKVLTEEIVTELENILRKIANDNKFSILEFNADKDYVRILIDCSPQHFIPDMMKAIKRVSARILMKKFGDGLRQKLWGGHLWNPSYFISTVSDNTEEQVRKYIQSQGKKTLGSRGCRREDMLSVQSQNQG